MWIAETIDVCRAERRHLAGRVALVPTMGALHEGHLSLIEAARPHADHIIVSIFVNPTQFGPNEDLARYPRPKDADLTKCREAGVVGVFHPTPEAMYPPGRLTSDVNVPALATILEGAIRPGHFAGVCRVVAKLFHIVQPDVAPFGLKDYQQLAVIHAMVSDLDMPVRLLPCPTLREADGLAMSSRNAYLGGEARTHALGLHEALQEAKTMVEQDGELAPKRVESAMRQVMAAHHVDPDYAVVRHPATLNELDVIAPARTGGVIALVAGRVGAESDAGQVRLIDNLLLGHGSQISNFWRK